MRSYLKASFEIKYKNHIKQTVPSIVQNIAILHGVNNDCNQFNICFLFIGLKKVSF